MFIALLSAFLGGLILNVMPCVFPVISLKALSLVHHNGDPARLRREGLGFFAGVLVTMLALAGVLIAVRAGGAAVGWGFQLQSPLVVAVLALVMLASALNLAGLFEVGASLQNAAGGIMPKDGVWGAAATGALAIIVATPCTAPLMAGALGYALVQPPLPSLAIFAALAIGFAAPFTLVSLFPALARKLPRPGAWMAVVKRVLAFPMFGAAAWLVWVLEQQSGSKGLGLILICAVVLSFGAWIYGIAQRRRLAGQGGLVPMAAVVVIAAGIALLLGTSYSLTSASVRTPDAPPATLVVAAGPIAWSPQKVSDLRAKGQPILVDFSASWCITCQVNEKVALSTDAVKTALRTTGTTYMIADSTNYNAEINRAMAGFGASGLPLYVVYPADGRPPVILPQVLTRQMVVTALQSAAHKGAPTGL